MTEYGKMRVYCGVLIDIETEKILEKQTLRIADGKIAGISQGFEPEPGNEQVVDWSGCWVGPGFFE